MKESVLNRVLKTPSVVAQQWRPLLKLVLLPAIFVLVASWDFEDVVTLPSLSVMPDVEAICLIALSVLGLLAGIFVVLGAVVSDDPMEQPSWVRCDEIVVARALYLLATIFVVLVAAFIAEVPVGAEIFPMLGYFVYGLRKPGKARIFALIAFSLSIVRVLTALQFGAASCHTALWAVSWQWMLCALSYAVISGKIWQLKPSMATQQRILA